MREAYQRGLVLYRLKRYEQALREFQEQLKTLTSDVDSQAMVSLCEMQRKRYVAARVAAEEAIRMNPQNARGYYALGWALYTDSRYVSRREGDIPRMKLVDNVLLYRLKLADRAVGEALRLTTRDATMWFLKSCIALDDMRLRDALTAANTGLAIDPHSTDCLRVRARALQELGDNAGAEASAIGALTHAPDSVFNHATAGQTSLRMGKRKEAKVHFLEALRLDPTLPRLRIGLRDALMLEYFFYRPVYWVLIRLGIFVRRHVLRHPIVATVVSLVIYALAIAASGKTSAMLTAMVYRPIFYGLLMAVFLRWLTFYCLLYDEMGRIVLTLQERMIGRGICAVGGILLGILFFLLVPWRANDSWREFVFMCSVLMGLVGAFLPEAFRLLRLRQKRLSATIIE